MLHRKSTYNTPVTYVPLKWGLFVSATVPPLSTMIGTDETFPSLISRLLIGRLLIGASIKPDWVLDLSILNSIARYLMPLLLNQLLNIETIACHIGKPLTVHQPHRRPATGTSSRPPKQDFLCLLTQGNPISNKSLLFV